jgi:hypothetical protein
LIFQEDSCWGNGEFIDIGRLKLNRRKQQEGIASLRNLLHSSKYNIKPIFAGAAISGLFAIFYDGSDYFRIKNILDNEDAHNLLKSIGPRICTVLSMKQTARNSLAQSDTRSNVV